MPRKRGVTQSEIESFRKRHPFGHALEEEEAKARREKAAFARCQRETARRVRRCLAELGDPGEDLRVQQSEESARRELGNATTHKRRLARLAEAQRDETLKEGA